MSPNTLPEKISGLTHKGLAFWAMVVAAVILVIAMLTGNVDALVVANMLLRVAIVLVASTLFNHFFLSRKVDVDAQIFSHPIATALYAGAVVLACALAVVGGSGTGFAQ